MSEIKRVIKNEMSIVLCGEAGMGIQTVEQILTRILKLAGYNVFATKEYMSRVRGGANSTEIRISSDRISAFVDRINFLIPLNKGAIIRIKERISPDTIILGEKNEVGDDFKDVKHKFIDSPFSKIAKEIGDEIYSNIVVVGVLSGILDIGLEKACEYIMHFFSSKEDEIIKNNVEAMKKGYQIGTNVLTSEDLRIEIQKNEEVKNEILINGTEAVGLGAIAGGCDFIAAYPMSPSTGVLVFLANQSKEFDMIVEQAEDEIAAMNMSIGSWIGGGRGMVTTSGGGFALMEEAVSLAGIFETPAVIHLAQRSGPATGLPTRTEQADLNLALYSGHGEFPRVIFSPGKIEDAFYLTQRAFNLADKYQIPVIILTDQYFVDTYYNIPSIDLSKMKVEKHIVETDSQYKRYKLTSDGISPRGVPNFGSGIVKYCGNEHNEEGTNTEDPQIRAKMVKKRLKKLEQIKTEIIPPELFGKEDYKILVIGWGSTYNIVKEAIIRLGRDYVSFLHFKQVYPLYDKTKDFISRAAKVILIENNATSQFGGLIKLHTGVDIETKILKYNGTPFSVEEIVESLKREIR